MRGALVTFVFLLVAGGAYLFGFHQGEISEAQNSDSVAKQFRGWQSLAALAWEKDPGGMGFSRIFSRVYFMETYALAMRMNFLTTGQAREFQAKVQSLSKFVEPELRPYAKILEGCVTTQNSQNVEMADRCLKSALPPAEILG